MILSKTKKMHYIKVFTIVCMIAFVSCSVKKSSSVASSSGQLKILCYNIHHANPPSKTGLIDIDAIANVINNANADVVALQEVDKLTKRSGLDEAKVIAEKTGMNYHFFRAIDHDGGEYGLAILSRHELKDAKLMPLPQKHVAEKRILSHVKLTVQGKEFVFANTHLDASRTHDNRNVQMEYILKYFENFKLPIILCGDLNSVAGSEAINLLDKQFKRTCVNNCSGTIPQDLPKKTIDYIAIKNANWPVLHHDVIAETYASDHRPIVATFKIE